MIVWVAHIKTEACDDYYWAFTEKPDPDELIERVWESEYKCEDLEFYQDTCSVDIMQLKVE